MALGSWDLGGVGLTMAEMSDLGWEPWHLGTHSGPLPNPNSLSFLETLFPVSEECGRRCRAPFCCRPRATGTHGGVDRTPRACPCRHIE